MDDRDGFDRFDPRFDYKYPTSSQTSPNRKPSKYDGVEYIPSAPQGKSQQGKQLTDLTSSRGYPSGGARSGGSRRPPGDRYRSSGGSGRQQGSAPKRKMKSQSQSQLYMWLIVGAGAIFCLGAFFLMWKLLAPSPVKLPESGIIGEANTEPPSESQQAKEAISESDAEMTGVISGISMSSGVVTLVSAEDDSVYQLYVNAQTQYKSKYGQAMTLSQFYEGDIIIAEYNSINKKAQLLRADPEAWIKSSIKNVEINYTTPTVKISNDTYGVSKNVLFLPEGTEPSVKTADTVTVKGRKQKILAVIVEKRTGTLEFTNKDKIVDGTVEVDSDIYKALDEIGSLKVSTGTHTVVVKGTNIEVFIKEITVQEGETIVIDLEEAQKKEGVLNLSVNVPDYTLIVNDEEAAGSSKPLTLPFGAYKLKVTKDGYTPWEGNVTVNQASINVTATLEEEVKTGKITVTTDPEYVNGSVYIDNALIGVAPINRVSVTFGTHQLTIKAPGYTEESHTIIVEGDVIYNVVMHPLSEPGLTGNTGNTGYTGNTGSFGDPGYNEGANFPNASENAAANQVEW